MHHRNWLWSVWRVRSPRISLLLAEDQIWFNPVQAQRPQTKEFQHPSQQKTGIPSPVGGRTSANLLLLAPSQPSVSTTPVKVYHLHQTTHANASLSPKTQAHPEMVLCQIAGHLLANLCWYTKLNFLTCSQSQELEDSAEVVTLRDKSISDGWAYTSRTQWLLIGSFLCLSQLYRDFSFGSLSPQSRIGAESMVLPHGSHVSVYWQREEEVNCDSLGTRPWSHPNAVTTAQSQQNWKVIHNLLIQIWGHGGWA